MEKNLVTWKTTSQFFSIQIVDEYYVDIVEILSTRFAPREFTTTQMKNLVVKDSYYQLISGHLNKLEEDNILSICVMEHERPIILA
jgi:hypothetical protein